MSDERPRPAFGEYATPAEQQAHIREPLPQPVTPPLAGEQVVPQQPAPQQPVPYPAAPPTAGAAANRIFTLVLLALGLVNVITALPGMFQFSESINEAMKVLGVAGEFTNYAAGRTWGAIAAAVLIIGYAATAYLTWRRLRAQKLSWWIPLVGAVVTYFIVYICLAVPLIGDPAFMTFVQNSAG